MENKKTLAMNIFLMILYAIFTLVLVLHHEVWADEAQVWLVVRDLDIWGLLRHVRTEGHPLLWYFLVFPFAKLNFNVISMQILNWAIVVSSAVVFLWKAPFKYFCKISILLSSAFLYWFPVISRSYCLIPLLIFLLAWFYKRQKEHPYFYASCLILLSQTHVIIFGFCFALFALFFYENFLKNKDKKPLLPLLLMFLSLLFVVCYLYGSQNENYIVQTFVSDFSLEGFKNIYSKAVFNLFGSVNVFNSCVLAFLTLFTALGLLLKDKKMFFVFAVNLIYQSAVFVFVWSIIPQRAFAFLLVMIFCLWVAYEKFETNPQKLFLNVILALVFFSTSFDGLNLIKKDLYNPFSGGKKTAEFIKKNIPENAFILSSYPITTTSVSAYLPKNKWKFYYDGYKDFYSYTVWNKPILQPFVSVPLGQYLREHEIVYVIMSVGAFYEDVVPVYSSQENVLTNQEKFNIYKFEGYEYGK